MAVAYESVQTTAFATVASGGTITITKPVNLAVGDTLVAHLSAIVAAGGNADWNTPSGWTSLVNQNQSANANSEARLTVFYKVADSSDVSASDFTFQTNTDACMAGGALYRISGSYGAIQGAINVATDTTTPSFSNTVTPAFSNSLVLFLTTCADASKTTGSVTGYATATSSPTFTEVYDFTGDISSRRGIMAGAYGSRPQTTATGNSSCTYTNYSQNSVGAVVVFETTPIVQSSSTASWEGKGIGETLSVNKPSGTEDGDLLIAHIATASEDSGGVTLTAPSGWTQLLASSTGAFGTAGLNIYYKTASSEPASWSWTNASSIPLLMAGGILRISNWGGILTGAIDSDDTADSTPTFTNTITPLTANSLLLFFISANDNAASGSVSGYSITTSNPTWTELYDQYGDGTGYFGAGDGDGLMSAAYAIRPQSTATGDSTVTLATFANRSVGAIVSVQAQTSVAVIGSTGILTLTGNAGTVSGAANVTGSTGVLTLNGNAGTVTTPAPDWLNQDKSATPSWTNPDKS